MEFLSNFWASNKKNLLKHVILSRTSKQEMVLFKQEMDFCLSIPSLSSNIFFNKMLPIFTKELKLIFRIG